MANNIKVGVAKMANIDTKNLVLHGVGSAVLLDQNGNASATLMRLQDMTIEVTSESEDVYGGDSLFPFFNYVTSKSASFSFTNAVFDMAVLASTQGVDVEEGAEAIGSETVTVSADKATLSVTTGLKPDTAIVIANGVALKYVAGTPATGEFSLSDAGALTFFAGDIEDNTKVEVSYVYEVADGSAVHILTDSVAGFVELRHISNVTELPDGTKVQVHTRVYKARCDGGFNLEYTRDGAVAPKVTFKSVDPQRTDKRFVSYSLVKVA